MNNAEFQLQGVGDPRLAVHATSPLPAWLWSTDGTRVLWANPVGARLFGAANGASLAKKTFGPADSHRRQVAQLAHRLPPTGTIRLQRLRGFGTALGALITCGCARLEFADGSHGILIVAAEPVGRPMPLVERLQRLVEDIDSPIAAFARDGMFVGASDAARSLLGFSNLSEAGLDDAREGALKQGRSEMPVGIGHMVLQRVGSGADVGLVALIATGATQAAHLRHPAPDAAATPAQQPIAAPGDLPIPDYERPAISGEAPAEFALIDEFAEAPDRSAVEPIAAEPPPVAAVADAPAPAAVAEPPAVNEAPVPPSVAPQPVEAPQFDEPSPQPRRHPLRFMWQMDADGRFALGSDEFTRLIGARTAAGFGRPWSDIAETFGLDPEGRVVKAIATRHTWSGIILDWPVDGGSHLAVELSGLPVHDRARNYAGYRGFGVCRDLDGLARLDALRRQETLNQACLTQECFNDAATAPETVPQLAVAADLAQPWPAAEPPAAPDVAASAAALESPTRPETSQPTDLETPVEPPKEVPKEVLKNVVPFRPISEPRAPVLSPVENSAFDELARQLSARLENENGAPAAAEAAVEPQAAPETPEKIAEQPSWLARPEPPARGETRRDRMLLDLLPVGVLIYRLDRLLYANAAFLERVGYPSLYTLEQAGGLDALYVEPGVSSASSTSDTGTPVTIAAPQAAGEHTSAIDARLYTISWDDESALALIFSGAGTQGAGLESGKVAAAIGHAVPAPEPSAVGHADAEELGAILDTTAEGIVMFDAEGHINSCNRSAEALFGHDGAELVRRNVAELFAPESQSAVKDYLGGIKGSGVASLLDHGREVLGRVRGGGLIPLSMTMGRTRPDGPNFFAVFRDLSQSKTSETELREARRLADRSANARADLLARISHEVRTPLNAIIGFAEVMIGERFGALGNERYVEYMKDIRASGERVIAIIDDLTDLSRIETGKLDLAFASQNLNDLVESCVAVMQPQANRERIIIRTSLAHMLPPVVADARALRQIALNLIGNSIHLANAGGQVIVSTALTDFGEVALRVRDTGHGLNDNEVAAALEPFRTQAPSDQAPDGSGVSLSLTKALVEANRAQFHIRTGARSGTLIEVVFSQAMARA
ncbi:MAG: PAS domain-containing sensor histidine kinase [Bradyrhizobium sp.]|jgi:PAS domain S-box-containing protein|uniref:PAS domain-containing protein n=1 Tax=Bradyrhizobium sp. TaxID=376 RepID=UPI0011FDA8E8|nr:PAS domain-containing protein [Bradyrhizobium sp.]THD51149.1 MAG: PAS domain-containing sensor histidine kinase [Bradyrhizobium sp.]